MSSLSCFQIDFTLMPRPGHDDRELWLFCGDLWWIVRGFDLHAMTAPVSKLACDPAFSTSFKTPCGAFSTDFLLSLSWFVVHHGHCSCTVDVSTGCVIVSLEPHASEPSELCVFNPQIAVYNVTVSTHRDLVHNHTCSSTSPVLDHAAFVLACSTSMLTPVSVLVKMVSFTHCDMSRCNE